MERVHKGGTSASVPFQERANPSTASTAATAVDVASTGQRTRAYTQKKHAIHRITRRVFLTHANQLHSKEMGTELDKVSRVVTRPQSLDLVLKKVSRAATGFLSLKMCRCLVLREPGNHRRSRSQNLKLIILGEGRSLSRQLSVFRLSSRLRPESAHFRKAKMV